jgi:poly(A) polymerase
LKFPSGAAIVNKIIVGSASWSELFKKHDFFLKYRYYLQIIASAGDADMQLKWSVDHDMVPETSINITRSGTVQSKIRQLVMKLEFVETITIAHPFIKGFEDVCYCLSDAELRSVSQGDVSQEVRGRRKEDIVGKEGAATVHSTHFFIGLAIEPKQGASCMSMPIILLMNAAGANGPRRLDISYPTQEFTKLVKTWDQFEEDKMSIVVRNIKRSVTLISQWSYNKPVR